MNRNKTVKAKVYQTVIIKAEDGRELHVQFMASGWNAFEYSHGTSHERHVNAIGETLYYDGFNNTNKSGARTQ